jgi:hypothetical protein
MNYLKARLKKDIDLHSLSLKTSINIQTMSSSIEILVMIWHAFSYGRDGTFSFPTEITNRFVTAQRGQKISKLKTSSVPRTFVRMAIDRGPLGPAHAPATCDCSNDPMSSFLHRSQRPKSPAAHSPKGLS